MRKHYSIGDVSKRLGISRDTLRFYEKKGMILPHKLENGYRCYTYEDIRKLLDILFYRRLNFSIEDINRLLNNSSYDSYYRILEEKIVKEEYELAVHRQSLLLLHSLKRIYKNIDKYRGRYEIRPLSRYYQIGEGDFSGRLDIFDLCYIYQEFHLLEGTPKQTDEYYLLAAETAALLGLENDLNGHRFHQHRQCVYTIIASPSRVPDTNTILEAVSWAKEQGYRLAGIVYTGFLICCAGDEARRTERAGTWKASEYGRFTEKTHESNQKREVSSLESDRTEEPVYFIELYLPLKPNSLPPSAVYPSAHKAP